jgi:uncharacterized membrane protein YqgA involved in biofilm formation
MCGGINLSQTVSYKYFENDKSKWSKLKPSILYNAGRVISYTVLGGIVGELLDFDRGLSRLSDFLQSRLVRGEGRSNFAEGFTNATLFVCVGAMAIVGSMQSGLTGNHETLLAKALIDGIVAVVMASTLGFGVTFSAFAVLVYEAALTLSAHAVSGLLGAAVINEITCAGSILILAIATNILKLTNIKVANFILAPFLPILLCRFF